MRFKSFILVLSLLLIISTLFGCSNEPTPSATPATVTKTAAPVTVTAPAATPEAEPWEWPETLSVASMGPNTAGYSIDVGWTTPLAEDTGMKVRLITETDPVVWYSWTKDGTIDISQWTFGTFDYAEAKGKMATRSLGPWDFRTFYSVGKGGRGFATRKDSGIKTPYDIKPGTRIIYHDFIGPLGRMWPDALLAWAQVDPNDIEWVPAGSIAATSDLLKEGRGDVVVGWPISPQWIEVEASPHGLAWIELDAEKDPEGAKRFAEADPSAAFGIMQLGVESARGVPMLATISGLIARADQDPELIYSLTKWLAENNDKYKDANPYCETMTVDTLLEMAEKDFVPLHDGAVKYLEELGLWTQAHEARRQQNIDLFSSYIAAYAEAIEMADNQGIKIDPANEDWLNLWEQHKIDSGLPKFKLFSSFP